MITQVKPTKINNSKEFLAATMEKTVYLREEKLYMAFKMFDKDDDGKITANELKEVLGSNKTKNLFYFLGQDMYVDKDSKFWDDLVKEVDLNGDGVVIFSFILVTFRLIIMSF